MRCVAAGLAVVLSGGGAVPSASAEKDGRVESAAALAIEVAPRLVPLLAPSGWRVVRPDGVVVVELWPARSLARLEEGILVGAVRLPLAGQDVRGRTIPAGPYSLRYVKVSAADRHRDCLRRPDFLALIRAGDDPEPDARLTYHEMVELSSRVAGRHPAVWQVEILPSSPRGPHFVTSGTGADAFTFPLSLAAGAVDLTVVLPRSPSAGAARSPRDELRPALDGESLVPDTAHMIETVAPPGASVSRRKEWPR